MNDCTFTRNAGGQWQCPECGWTYTRQADTPPRRNCPAGAGSPKTSGKPARRTPRDAVLARYDAAPNPLPIAREEVERRVGICGACERFPRLICITAGSRCQRPNHWQLKVLTLDCERW